ncbi:hypothetical protein [Nostoc sp. FACHB-110]|uniref:hypothetical protein n=1 Tax=Nostoc sp. FACHB-110 TaxID=2692834 RepID=UPI001688DDA8|nr:hypothetical protein [Nostoc sp. FACHB-110]MBD2435837.1 hypothetical protein [Nostoc sp. FACHB-110]
MSDYEKFTTLLQAEIDNSPPEIAAQFRQIIARVNTQLQQDTEVEVLPPLTEEQLDAYLNSVSCPECWGTGRIYVLDSPSKCGECNGTGYL